MQKSFGMNLLVCANEEQVKELSHCVNGPHDSISWVGGLRSNDTGKSDVIFLLDALPDIYFFEENRSKIIFLNEVIRTNAELQLQPNVIRINGWPGFLSRKVWECVGEAGEKAKEAAALFGKELIRVKDVPGLISARVIAAIIAEAFMALDEGVSTREQIDLALKAGTNYPFGPFEWNEKIGAENIENLNYRIAGSHDHTDSKTRQIKNTNE